MIRTSHTTIRRAAAVVLAAAAFSFTTHHASAQTLNLFSGAIGTPPSLAISSTLTLGNVSNSGNFGPTGYSGTVSLVANVADTLSEGFSGDGVNNSFYISQTSAAVLGGTATATKNFGPQLAPNTTYSFSLTRTNTSTVGLLGSFNITLSNGATQFVNTGSGFGLIGVVDVLNLFGTTGTTSTFTFTTPSTYVAANGLSVNFTGNLPVAALGGSYVFSGASITQVPEPGTVAAMIMGAGGLVALRFRRRLRSL